MGSSYETMVPSESTESSPLNVTTSGELPERTSAAIRAIGDWLSRVQADRQSTPASSISAVPRARTLHPLLS